MAVSISDFDVSVLSIADRIRIAQDLLDSVLAETQGEYFTAEQLAEIDRRVVASDAGQVVGERWETVFAQLIKQ